jgi:antibiotic biosynthesis monooxygenase (ABM) superfamily enzyme
VGNHISIHRSLLIKKSMPGPTTPSGDSVKLVTAMRVREGMRDQFLKLNGRLADALLASPGFTSREVIPPQSEDIMEWIFITRFDSIEHLRAWRKSDARDRLFSELKPLLEGEFTELVGDAAAQYHLENSVTEVILEQVAPGKETAYQQWSNRIQQAQAASPGYQGGYSQPPKTPGAGWMTLMRFSSIDDLNRWMNSPVRKVLLEEAKDLVAASYQHRVDTSFPGWVPTDPASGMAPPNWKVTMLVLLGLYPIVCLEILFLMKRLAQLGLKSALAGFVGNAISVTLVAYVTMPYLVRWLNWWLLPKPDAPKNVHWKGTLVVFALYALSVAIFWKFM